MPVTFDGFLALGVSLGNFFSFWPLLYALTATLAGIIVGCLPGLSATLAIALLTTLTIKMPPNDAILILICAYVGAIYGGSRTAILLNIPGTAANAAACLDGYQLALKGQAGRAMGISTCGSVAGSLSACVHGHADADAGRSGAVVRRLWSSLAGAGRRDDVRHHSRQATRSRAGDGLGTGCSPRWRQDGIHAHDRSPSAPADCRAAVADPVLIGAFGFARSSRCWPSRCERRSSTASSR